MWESEREALQFVEEFLRSRKWRYSRFKIGASLCVHHKIGSGPLDIYLGRFDDSGSRWFVAQANLPFTFNPNKFLELECGADLVNPILEPSEITPIYGANQVRVTTETKYAGKLSDLIVARSIFSTLFVAQSLAVPIQMISDGRAAPEAMLNSLLERDGMLVC